MRRHRGEVEDLRATHLSTKPTKRKVGITSSFFTAENSPDFIIGDRRVETPRPCSRQGHSSTDHLFFQRPQSAASPHTPDLQHRRRPLPTASGGFPSAAGQAPVHTFAEPVNGRNVTASSAVIIIFSHAGVRDDHDAHTRSARPAVQGNGSEPTLLSCESKKRRLARENQRHRPPCVGRHGFALRLRLGAQLVKVVNQRHRLMFFSTAAHVHDLIDRPSWFFKARGKRTVYQSSRSCSNYRVAHSILLTTSRDILFRRYFAAAPTRGSCMWIPDRARRDAAAMDESSPALKADVFQRCGRKLARRR